MQAGVNKRGVRSFFTYFTVPFIIAIVLIYVAWYYIFQWINNVHDWEKITIFAECEGVKESIGHDLLEYMNEEGITEDEVKEVDIYAYSAYDSNLYNTYLSLGVYSDLLIMTRQDLDDTAEYLEYNFLEISDDVLEFSNLSYLNGNIDKYYYNDTCFGLKIYDPSDDEYNEHVGFINWLNFEDEPISYYLVINLFSANIKEFEESSTTNNAFIALNYLFARYTEF